MNWTIGRSIPCETRWSQKESSLEAGEPELLPVQRRGCLPAACQACRILRGNQHDSESFFFVVFDANFRISHKPWQMSFSQSQAELEVNAVIPKELCKFGVSRGVCFAVSFSEDPSCECRDRRTATAVRKRPPPPPPLHEEEMAVFVAVFGEPLGVVDCNKQSHCHSSQTLTGCVSWKEKTMETSKVVPPPLGEPPSPSHSSYPPRSTKQGCEDGAAHRRGAQGAPQRSSLKGKKRSP